MMRDVILVVEGKSDYAKIKQIYPKMPILTTNGSAVSDKFLNMLKELSQTKEIVLFLDPDFAGEKIRKQIYQQIPNAKHVFVQKDEAISSNMKKIGVEHVDSEVLKEKLKDIKMPKYDGDIDLDYIYSIGLCGKADSNKRRIALCERLNIGHVNAKQLVKRLNMFGYKKIDIMKVMELFND